VATARTVVGCPGKVSIDGRVFPNENDFDLGRISLISAFANSCNTTFTELSQRLPDEALTRAAAEYGIGAGWQLPVDSFSGSLPPPRDRAEKAADAIGQGRVLVSPLAEALMAATVVRGSTPAPTLVAGHPAAASAAPHPPPARVLATLRGFMRAVVTGGTATELRAVPGGPVSGKTGTAEHGTHRPLRAHAWFMGFQPGAASAGGDLAFALIVENGQTSGQPALPLVAKFLAGVR
jgi:cell division protein FtsI/penicillin-binding protein 2